jgi:ferredoxin--NADP+ reductase
MSPASNQPLRVAVVGAGPAGFYAADRLLKADGADVHVEMLDRLPTPWGLVRAGVAPDHPKIKAVTRVYEKTAALDGFHFHGNLEVGKQLSHHDLLAHHHAVIYAYGASGDRKLGIPGEDLDGVIGATELVAWYNGHPDAADLEVDLDVQRAVVVGNGNVAVDVARMLVLPRDELAVTDIADYAMEAIAASPIEEAVILGRRGPAQAAYTTPELRELGELTQADVIVDPAEAELDPASAEWLQSDAATPTNRRNVDVVQDYAQREPSGKPKRVVLRFLVSPVEIRGEGRAEEIVVARNELVAAEDGTLRAVTTEETETIPAGLILRSIGYRGQPIEGVPFAEHNGTILNEAGRVFEDGEPVAGVYATGWIKRGPSGVIGTNKKCAYETVDHLLADAADGKLLEPTGGRAEFDALIESRGAVRVDYEGWKKIDEFERGRGEAEGRPRVKVTSLDELIERAERS